MTTPRFWTVSLLNVRFPALAKRRGSSAVGLPLPDAGGG